jgi:hypothetical protein
MGRAFINIAFTHLNNMEKEAMIKKFLAMQSMAKFIEWLNTEYGISGMRKDAAIVCITIVGGSAGGESSETDDIDMEVIFNDPKYANFETVAGIKEQAAKLDSKFDVYVKLKSEYAHHFFKTVGKTRYAPVTLLYNELVTTLTIAGEDFISKLEPVPIPKEESAGIMYAALVHFNEGKYAKSILYAAFAVFLKRSDTLLNVKDREVYKAIATYAKEYFGDEDGRLLDKAYQAKLGNGHISEGEAKRFIAKVNKMLLQII